MHRRRLLALCAGGVGALAGCSGGGDAGERTVNPALRSTPTATPTPTATATPEPPAYGAGEADSLDRPRSVVVVNRFVTPQWIALRIADGETTAVERTLRVPAAGRTTLDAVIGAAREYDVAVRTTDRRRGNFAWAPGPGGGDLGIDLGGRIAPRDTYSPSTAGEFVVGSTGGLLGGDATAELVVDTPEEGGRVRVTAADGAGSAGVDLRVPAGSRVPVPLTLPRGPVSVAVDTPAGSDTHEWVPAADGPLYCLNGSPPRLVCDLLIRDVVVENATDADVAVDVAVVADGTSALDWTVYPVAGGRVRVPTAIPPAGSYVIAATAGDREARRRLDRCPERGPLTVRVTDDGVALGSRPTE
ncbi:hypothetical protein [Halobaculum lipolyticum]|uniref:Ig-like domain-containing protein n=1 Tax=Halobaculum lipolyticum TaxID=3032001 RepID=A0ABD5WC60_9EURY|nr:hypothetical protein [Halobaculum sp. DT31]